MERGTGLDDENARELLRRDGWDLSPIPALAFGAGDDPLAMNPAAARLCEGCSEFVAAAAAAAQRGREAPHLDSVGLVAASGPLHLELLAMPRSDCGLVLVVAQDHTLEKNLRDALIDSRRRFRDLLDLSGTFGWEVDAEGLLTFVSQRGALGYSAEALIGRPASHLVSEQADDLATLPFVSPVPVDEVEVELRLADGRSVPHLVSSIPLFDENGRRSGARGVCRDVGIEREQERSVARVLQRERLIARVLEGFRSEVDPLKALTSAAEALSRGMAAVGCQIVSAAPSLSAEEPTFEILARHGETGGTTETQLACAGIVPDRVSIAEVRGWSVLIGPSWFRDHANGALLLWRLEDQTAWDEDDRRLADLFATHVGIAIEQVQQHRRLINVAVTDPLTGVLNRRGFQEEVRRRMQRAHKTGAAAALMYVDLDNFKAVNDAQGHAAGDDVLIFVRDLLRGNTRPTDLIGRLGGDEFALWLDGAGRKVAEKRANLILAASGALRRFSGSAAQPLGLSIGIVIYNPSKPETLEQLVARADALMYQVKRGGRGGYAVAEAAVKE